MHVHISMCLCECGIYVGTLYTCTRFTCVQVMASVIRGAAADTHDPISYMTDVFKTMFGNRPGQIPVTVLRRAFVEYRQNANANSILCGGPLLQQLLARVHDEAHGRMEEVLTKLHMESNVSAKVWSQAVMKRIQELLKLVGAPDSSRLQGKGAVDAKSMLQRMPWLKLRYTTTPPAVKSKKNARYPHGTAGVNAEPHDLIKGWLLQYIPQLMGIFFLLDSHDNLTVIPDIIMKVVVIIDANVVSKNSKLGNAKGVFHTTAVVLKVIFWKGQDKVHDLILGVLYVGNDHYFEFKAHAALWVKEVCNLKEIAFKPDDNIGIKAGFALPFKVVAVLPDGAGFRDLWGKFSIGRFTIFDSPYHSLPNILRFSPKYADVYRRPIYSSPTTGGKSHRLLVTNYAKQHGDTQTKLVFNYKRPSLIDVELDAVLNGLFHDGTGLAKWFAARITESVGDGGVESKESFVAHCCDCLGFYFKYVHVCIHTHIT